MSLDPSPLSPRPTPLLSPIDPVPGRGSALMGAGIATVLAIIVGFVSMRLGTPLLYAPQGLKTNAIAVKSAAPFRAMGFDYYWLRSLGGPGYGSTDNATNNFTSEQQQFHMNMVIIDITANQDSRACTNTCVNFDAGNPKNLDTYTDDTYTALVQKARSANVLPVFRLAIHGENQNRGEPWPGIIGADWRSAGDRYQVLERQWFNSYTAFAVHYAQLAQKLTMPLLIFGSNLVNLTTDDPNTADGSAVQPTPDEKFTCSSRRECEWRHVVAAIHNATYLPFGSTTPIAGGGYTGSLSYAASSRIKGSALSYYEWNPQYFKWWSAVDIIGIDAFYPLTTQPTQSITSLLDAWNGKSTIAAASSGGNLVKQLGDLSKGMQRNILFTSAGYESYPGSNIKPGDYDTGSSTDLTTEGMLEQQNDMNALYAAFADYPWWLGVVWSSDYAVWPRSSLANVLSNKAANDRFFGIVGQNPNWNTNTQWAGDCLTGCTSPAKDAGAKWLTTIISPPITITNATP